MRNSIKSLDAEKDTGHHPFAQILDSRTLAEFLEIESQGEKDFVKELVEIYLQYTEAKLAELQNAFSARDSEKIKNKLHSLKGSSGTIGITKLFQAFGRLEIQVLDEDWTQIQTSIHQIRQDFALIKNKVSSLIGFRDENES